MYIPAPIDIKHVFKVLSPQLKRRFGLLIFYALGASALESVNVVIVLKFVEMIGDPGRLANLPIPWKPQFLSDAENLPTVFLIGALAMAIFFLAKNLLLGAILYQQKRFHADCYAWTAQELYKRYLLAPYECVFERNSADLINNIFMAKNIAGQVLSPLVDIVTEVAIITGILAVLLISEPQVTLATGTLLVATAGGFHFLFRQRLRHWGARQAVLTEETIRIVQEGLGSLKEVRVLGRERSLLGVFDTVRWAAAHLERLIQLVMAAPRLVNETIIIWVVAFVVVLIFASGRPSGDYISILGLFAFAGFRLMPSMNRLTGALSSLSLGKEPVRRICEDLSGLNATNAVDDNEASASPPAPFSTQIEISGLSYQYPGAGRDVLFDVSLTIRKGEAIGIVGPSGSGKTTLIDLLLGLFPARAGTFMADGQPLDPASSAWQRLFAYVPQEVFLYDDTLRRNIAFGLPDSAINEGKLQTAIRLASLELVIADLPQGIDTVLKERGVRLSGGQRQRIGIARALYHDPDILVLDEATSALDAETEREIVDAIERLKGIKTVVLIAHRLTTVRHCDRLVFLRDGRIVDVASFEELRRRNTQFAHMVQLSELGGGTLDEAASEPPRGPSTP